MRILPDGVNNEQEYLLPDAGILNLISADTHTGCQTQTDTAILVDDIL